MRAGLAAEFAQPRELTAAVRRLRALGFRRLDLHTPYVIEEAFDALELPRSPISTAVAVIGFWAAGAAYVTQWFLSVIDYPLNAGGRPPHAVPAFFFITFETGILWGAFTALVALLLLSGLPRLTQPIFEVEGFERASIDRYFLTVDRRDPIFDEPRLQRELEALGAVRVSYFGRRDP